MKLLNLFIPLFSLFFIIACTKEDTPQPDAKNVTIYGIEIISMPLTDNGLSWDIDGDADVFFKISNSNTVLFENSPAFKNVSNQDLPLTIPISNGYKLPILDQSYSILLYDYDATSGNDYIGGISFNPSSYKSERPDSKTYANSDVQIKVNFKWE